MRPRRKRKIQELGQLTFFIAGKGTVLRGKRKFCIGSRLLSSPEQDSKKGFFTLGLGTYLQKPGTGVLPKIKDPFPRMLSYVRASRPPALEKDPAWGPRHDTILL